MTRPPDVWHWTVEDVTDFLRGDAVQYIRRDVPHASFPSLEQLATKLIENGVDGVTLLTAVDLAFLRDECGIKALGERTAYLRCIRHLQDSSSRYSTKDEPIQWPTPDSITQPAHLNERQTTPVAYATAEPMIGEGPRDGEQHVDDGRGRKRRRLDSSAIVTDHNSALDHRIMSPDDGIDDPTVYLPEKSYSIDGLFFGNTVLGAAVGVLPPRHALFINDGEDEESDDFQYVNPLVQSGLAQYAHGCTKHFLHAPEEANMTRNAQDALVVYPYRDRMNAGKALAGSKSNLNGRLMPDSVRSAFVVQYALETTSAALRNDEERVFITRETDAMITSSAIDLGYSVEDAAQIGGEYDHLLMKYRHRDGDVDIIAFPYADDDATTVATDDGADLDDDNGDDLAEVDDESQAGQIDIPEVVDSAIETYQHEWRESKLPVLVKKEAWSVWKKMKRSRTVRDELVRGAQRVIVQLDNRLIKYRNYLSTMQWDGEASLRRQCEMLEPTVHDREKELWKISIWSASQTPARPSRSSIKPAHGPGTTAQQPSANGATLQTALNLLGPGDRIQIPPQRDVNRLSQTLAEEPIASAQADDEHSTTAEPDEPLTTAGSDDFVMPDEAAEDDQEQIDDIVMSDEALEDDEQHQDNIEDSEHALRSDTLNHEVDMVEKPTDGADNVLMAKRRSTSPEPVHDEINESSDLPRSFRHAHGTESALSTEPSRISEVIKEESPDDTHRPRSNDSNTLRTPVKSNHNVIDLTFSTDSSASRSAPRRKAPEIIKPSKKPRGAPKSSTPSRKSKPAPLEDPLLATASDVDEWDFDQLAETKQRKHLLIKMLKEAGQPVQELLWQTWQELARAGFKQRLITAILHVNDNEGLHEVMEAHIVEAMQKCARMAYAWYCSVLPRVACDPDMIQQLLQDGQVDMFVAELRPLLQKRTSKLFVPHKSATQATPYNLDPDEDQQDEVDDDDEADDEAAATPSSKHGSAKKAKEVKQDEVAKTRRSNAQARSHLFTQVQSQSQLSSNPDMLSQMIAANPSQSGLAINPLRDAGDPPIFINQTIAHSLKNYQHEGVRFLWREITARDSAGSQGAVLAHTMGLGKTMQSIAMLMAVDEASQSPTAKIRHQLPPRLQVKGDERRVFRRRLCFLILCPASLLRNWQKEIKQWAPQGFGGPSRVFVIETTVTRKKDELSYAEILKEWHRMGGLLLIGYSIFRALVMADDSDESRKPGKASRVLNTPEHRDLVQTTLLAGTNLVVADEAHALKDDKIRLSKAADMLETHSRIALTGTPMSNDVNEIFSLISWVAPGYLGGKTEFQGRFANPIKAGLWQDSDVAERRRSKVQLTVLHREIAPKVHRADITVLRGSLKSKVEFVITVELTDTQRAAYSKYIHAITGAAKGIEDVSQMRIFGWLDALFLLNNHPTAYRRRILESLDPKKRMAKNQKRRTTAVQGLEEAADGNVSESTVDSPADILAPDEPTDEGSPLTGLGFDDVAIKALVEDLTDTLDPALSAKVSLLMRIIELSQACEDQLLLFSHKIPTLDYLEKIFAASNIKCARIDGNVATAKRSDILKDFSEGKYSLLLISTKAGSQGLNIQCANRVILFDFSFNPSWEEQAIGRAYRLGQTKPVYVYRFIAGGTFETNLYNKTLFKTSLAQRVVDKRKPGRNAQRDLTKYLYHPRVVKHKDINVEHGKDKHVLDKIIDAQSARTEKDSSIDICAIDTMETLQQEAADEEDLNEEDLRRVEEEMQWRDENRTNRKLGLPEVMPRGLEHPSVAAAQASVPSTATAMTGPSGVGAAPSPAMLAPHSMAGPPMPATQVPRGMSDLPLQPQGFPVSHAWMNLPQMQNTHAHHFASGGRDVRNGTFQDGFAAMPSTGPTRPSVAAGRTSPDHGVHGLPTPRR
ncbi:hypothetical protein B0A48_10373 [Cryoendolithus antarcticus]|uniref:Uncharacterized protein n=1 Tax=Cryoendolithus antarcticus TaxID=1507870 RepID=A0A1V8SXK4_9PEZI|nr:hypothetical protein B0A48_10373 [Cryoendolithus antarcticus]